MNGFIMAPTHNKVNRADATGAFHLGAEMFQKVHSLPPWVRFENDETSKTSDMKGFLKLIRDQIGGWDVFAYFGRGDPHALLSADVRGRKGATAEPQSPIGQIHRRRGHEIPQGHAHRASHINSPSLFHGQFSFQAVQAHQGELVRANVAHT
jgi:hypothetical protein